MSGTHLSSRDSRWHGKAQGRGKRAESMFLRAMAAHAGDCGLVLEDKPRTLKEIYGKRKGRDGRMRPHGIVPECEIRNPENGKRIFVEVKRQYANGNAHERACRYMMPGVLDAMREAARQPKSVVPCWWIFTNGLAKDVHYRRAISLWFSGMERNMLFWPNMRESKVVIDHFDRHILPLLR